MCGLLRPDEARQLNRRARDRVGEGPGAAELVLNEALLLTCSGRPLEALAVLQPIQGADDPRQRALRAHAELPALVALGQGCRAAEQATKAFAEQNRLDDQVGLPSPWMHVVTEIGALAECGRLAEATALAGATYEATSESAPADVLVWLSHQLGRCALLTGRAATARRWFAEALARGEEHHLLGAHRLVLGDLATAHAWLGDAKAAATAMLEMDDLPACPFVPADHEVGRAWSLVAAGDLPGGREVLRGGAQTAAAQGYRIREAAILHDVVRLGDPTSVVDRLNELAGQCDGDLIAGYAMHAAASAAGRPPALVEAADRFESMGAFLLAAEAATEAAQAWQRLGDRRTSASLGQRASTLAGLCEGARTPGVIAPDHGRAAHTERARHRHLRGTGTVQPGDRRPALPVDPHRQQPSAERLLQARRERAPPTARRPRRGDDLTGSARRRPFHRAHHHGLSGEVVRQPPGVGDLRRPPRAHGRLQRPEEGVAHHPVVGRANPVTPMALTEGGHSRREGVE